MGRWACESGRAYFYTLNSISGQTEAFEMAKETFDQKQMKDTFTNPRVLFIAFGVCPIHVTWIFLFRPRLQYQ